MPARKASLERAKSGAHDRDESIAIDQKGKLKLISLEKLDAIVFNFPTYLAVTTFVVYIASGLALGMQYQGWSVATSLYFMFVTLTTVGYGDLILDKSSRWFGAFFVMVGVVFVSVAFSVVVDMFTTGKKSADNGKKSDDKPTQENLDQSVRDVWVNLRSCLFQVLVVLALGTAGFYYFEGSNVEDAFYWSCVTISTVGYGDIVPESENGRIFATLYICVGFLYAANWLSFLGSMPSELRKLQHQTRVLKQFGKKIDVVEIAALLDSSDLDDLRVVGSKGVRSITRAEFCLWMMKQTGSIDEDWMMKCFQVFDQYDTTGEGVLDEATITLTADQEMREVGGEGTGSSSRGLRKRLGLKK